MGTRRLVVGVVLTFALAVLTGTMGSESARASAFQDSINVGTTVESASYKPLEGLGVMVSVIKDGKVIKQMEVHLNSNAGFTLPPGTYDIRVEGEKMQTIVKRGILVNQGETTHVIGGPMRVGTGVRVIEYATGGLSREELAARLEKLEAAMAALQKK
jgi:hypothetical protein